MTEIQVEEPNLQIKTRQITADEAVDIMSEEGNQVLATTQAGCMCATTVRAADGALALVVQGVTGFLRVDVDTGLPA